MTRQNDHTITVVIPTFNRRAHLQTAVESVLQERRVPIVLHIFHVLDELRAYAPLVTIGSYGVVFDTIVEDLPIELFPDRPWGQGGQSEDRRARVYGYHFQLCGRSHDRPQASN